MRLPQSLASACSRFWSWLISPSLLFIAVMVSFPAFLFQKKLLVLVMEAATFFFLALTRRGKLRLLPSLLMIFGIVFFALLSPHGEVVARLGSFTITRGALEAGLARGVTLAGMVFLSQLALSPNLSLPGRAGNFIVDMFAVLDKLVSEPIAFGEDSKKFKGIFTLLDTRLYQVYWNEENGVFSSKDEGHFMDDDEGSKDGSKDGLVNSAEESCNEKKLNRASVRGIFVAILLPCVLYFLLWKSA